MKKRIELSTTGKKITFYIPETKEDIETLRKKVRTGIVSDKASFGDWK
jgi:hypothetical protein